MGLCKTHANLASKKSLEKKEDVKEKVIQRIDNRIAELLSKEQSPKSNVGNFDSSSNELHPTEVGDQSVVRNVKSNKKILDNQAIAQNLASV